ncbi:BMP family ABC transporter substrate-binding protein [Pelagibacterium montanilacus]|uniref:BMP family ABC transporter substrate-binding protein n=1 Tax=Pelagibacterium montanilacus TaxID=2185280 RepID=UPI000F8E0585|nr:BMP family ABC transporter substrate-binding protein [Pelagibacterium montanilacus]
MTFTLARRGFGLALAAGLLTSVSAGAVLAQEYTEDNPLKVAFVVHGTLGDKSFLDSAAEGLNRAAEELPVTVNIVEAGLERSRWQPALADVTDGDYDVVIAGTWEMLGFMTDLAPDYPEKQFILFDDTPDYTAGDYSNIMGIQYQVSDAAYLAGYAAASISETGEIGQILGVEGHTILEFVYGFEQGALAADPDVDLVRAVAGDFTDPARGKELALAQFAQGTDIVFPIAGGTGIGALQAARDEGKLAIGVDSDQATIFADTDQAQADVIFTSVEKKIGDSLYTALEQTIEGTATYGETLLLGLADGAVGISKNAQYEAIVPEDVRAEIEEIEQQIIAGDIEVDSAM